MKFGRFLTVAFTFAATFLSIEDSHSQQGKQNSQVQMYQYQANQGWRNMGRIALLKSSSFKPVQCSYRLVQLSVNNERYGKYKIYDFDDISQFVHEGKLRIQLNHSLDLKHSAEIFSQSAFEAEDLYSSSLDLEKQMHVYSCSVSFEPETTEYPLSIECSGHGKEEKIQKEDGTYIVISGGAVAGGVPLKSDNLFIQERC